MMFRAALALFALSAPVFAQHDSHAGSFGGRSSGGHAGFSGSPGFTRGFVSPTPPIHYTSPSFHNNPPAARYGLIGQMGDRVGFRGAVPPRSSGFRAPYNMSSHIPYNGNRFGSGRMPYHRSGAGGWDRGGHHDWDHDRDRDRFNRHRHEFNNNWYNYGNPYWLGYGYPYVIDPGFYDWGNNDSADAAQPSADNQVGPYEAYDQGGVAPSYPPSNPDEGLRPPYQRPAASAPVSAPAPPQEQQPLTVIFKDGRSPVKVRNYMMTAKVLTDLDPQHYEQIPLEQIDVAATQQANSAAGVKFQIPDAARD